jgi:hypothetical protein
VLRAVVTFITHLLNTGRAIEPRRFDPVTYPIIAVVDNRVTTREW